MRSGRSLLSAGFFFWLDGGSLQSTAGAIRRVEAILKAEAD
jgi:hypothetical protein